MNEYTIEQRIIYRLVEQHCTMPDGELFSGYLSSDSAAMRYLEKAGLIVVHDEGGRAVFGKLKEVPDDFYDLGDLEG